MIVHLYNWVQCSYTTGAVDSHNSWGGKGRGCIVWAVSMWLYSLILNDLAPSFFVSYTGLSFLFCNERYYLIIKKKKKKKLVDIEKLFMTLNGNECYQRIHVVLWHYSYIYMYMWYYSLHYSYLHTYMWHYSLERDLEGSSTVSMVIFGVSRIRGWFFPLFVYPSNVFIISMCYFTITKITTKVTLNWRKKRTTPLD